MATDATGGKTQESDPSKQPQKVSFSFLKEITNDFSKERIIGDGGAFGIVYMGILKDGKVITVKKLEQNSPLGRDKEFNDKVHHIMALKHENIVKMVAFCREEHEKMVESLLCYEYLPKGSLHKNLFAEPTSIDWGTRFKIIEGICQGLLFLHKLDVPIIHMDLKPENILLDDNMVPKIADFGLSTLFDKGQTVMHTDNVVGSYGYMAPEYFHSGEVSPLLDIYSLGVVIIEITTGEKNSRKDNDPTARIYIDKICEKWTEELIASRYSWLDSDCLQQVKACIKIGLECVEIDKTNRPSIDKIVDKLNERRAS